MYQNVTFVTNFTQMFENDHNIFLLYNQLFLLLAMFVTLKWHHTFRGGHSLKIGDGGAWTHWPPFFNSLSPIDPLFRLALTQWPPLFNNSQPILDNFSPNDPLFRQYFVKFDFFPRNFCQICVQIHTLRGKFTKICLILTVWLRFCWSSHWMTPFFGEKSLTERPLVLSCCPSTPVTSKVECPPPGWGWNVITPRCCKE